MTLGGKTLFISGGSRGIGLAIALRGARDGANVALVAKTAEPHPKLEGTVYTAAALGEPAHPDPVPAGQPRAALARPAHRLHDRQVRDDAVRTGLRR